MPKLTDAQLVALSSAAARDDAVASRPLKMTNAAAAKAAAGLVAAKLMREVLAKPGTPVWRKGDDGRDLSLVILRAGREAIGVEEELGEGARTDFAAKPPAAAAVANADFKPNKPRAKPKRAEVAVPDETATFDQFAPMARGELASEQMAATKALVDALTEAAKGAPRTGTKQAMVVAMLSSEDGVTLHALAEATGWLPHTTRAALTGLRKRGFAIERERIASGGSAYRIVAAQATAVAA